MKSVIDVNSLTTKLVKEGVVANPKTVEKAVKKSRVQTYKFERSFGTTFSEKSKGGYEILICEDSIPAIMKAIKEIQSKGEDVAEMGDLYRSKREREVTIEKDGQVLHFGSKKALKEFFLKEEGLKATGTRIKDGATIRGYTISMKKVYHTEYKYRYRVIGAN